MRALVTGCRGQVGAEIVRVLAGHADVVPLDRTSLDLADADAIARTVREHRPDLIVNAGAYTAVDRAETEPEAARAVNAVAPGVLAEEASRGGALLVHFSTDYVFDGAKPEPYVETDAPNPLNAYGRTKLEGELAIAGTRCDFIILRTSWVYGPRGRNFVRTMLDLAASRSEIRVVDDQHGAPTSSLQLAGAVADLLLPDGPEGEIDAAGVGRLREAKGLYHASAQGDTTWFDFAAEVFARRAARAPSFKTPRLIPIPSRDYPLPARRPANSLLSNAKLERTFGVRLGGWREGLRETMSAIE